MAINVPGYNKIYSSGKKESFVLKYSCIGPDIIAQFYTNLEFIKRFT
jgi:hypothetical protein